MLCSSSQRFQRTIRRTLVIPNGFLALAVEFYSFREDCYLMQFLLRKEDIARMTSVVAWCQNVTHTAQKGYGTTLILMT